MRKGLVFVLVLALVAGLFVSCNNEANEDIVYVEFSTEDGRSLVNDISVTDVLGNAYPIDSVYWYYTARKTTNTRGRVGSTLKAETAGDLDNLDNHNPVLIKADGGLSASIGPFSKGEWNFRLYGYDKKEGDDRKLIYTGVCNSANLTRIASPSSPLSISFDITNAITTGSIEMSDLIYYDGDDGDLKVKSTLTKLGTNSSLVYDMTQGDALLPAIEVTADNKPYENAIVGTYYYKVPPFGPTAPSVDGFTYIKEISYANGKLTAKMDIGAYRLVSELYYDSAFHTILDTSFIVYPGETKTITGGVYESTYLPYVQPTASSVAMLDHAVNDTTSTYWYNSLQDAVNIAASGETVYLLKDMSSVTLMVYNAIEIKGIKSSAINSEESSITTYANRNDLFVYTIKADTEDPTKVNLKFYSNPTSEQMLGWITDAAVSLHWLSGTLPNGFAKEDNNEIVEQYYLVAFNGNGATSGEMSNQRIKNGATQALTANAYARTGNTFAGWNTVVDGQGGTAYTNGQEVRNLTETPRATVTLYAQWTPNNYTITLNTNGGAIDNGSYSSSEAGVYTGSYTYGNQVVTLPIPTKEGNNFRGWYADEDCEGNAVTTISTSDYGNKTYYAKFTPHAYTVVFNGNGATGGSMSDQNILCGASTPLTANSYTKTGYSFSGWKTVPSGTGTSYANSASVVDISVNNGTVTLYAQWELASYTVSFNNGDSVYADTTIQVHYGQAYGTLPVLNLDRHTVEGWYTSPNLAEGEEVTAGTIVNVAEDHTLYAKLVERTYAIGSTGPAGGYIFYDCDADNDSGNADGLVSSNAGWRYLEMAPTDVRLVDGNPMVISGDGDDNYEDYNAASAGYRFGFYFSDKCSETATIQGKYKNDLRPAEVFSEALGTGKTNSSSLFAKMNDHVYMIEPKFYDSSYDNYIANDSSYFSTGNIPAAFVSYQDHFSSLPVSLCENLVYGGKDDWFLPSRDELIAIYTNLFKDKYTWTEIQDGHPYGYMFWNGQQYWSSSEVDRKKVNGNWTYLGAFVKHIYLSQNGYNMSSNTYERRMYELRVRPVRMF